MSSPKEQTDREPTKDQTELTKGQTEPTKDQTEKDQAEKDQIEKDQADNKDEQQVSQWTPVWDDSAQAYYWWNTETNETTWNNPQQNQPTDGSLDFLLNRIDPEDNKKTIEKDSYGYYDYYPDEYTSQAHFNARTGRFTTQADVERLNPENLTIESRATRQMQNYFDVDLYTEQRNAERMLVQSGRVPKRKPLTRKEVEYFKRMKKEKKSKRAREWLLQ